MTLHRPGISRFSLAAATLATGALLITAAMAMFDPGSPPSAARAQAPSCSTTTVSGQGDGRFATADVGNAIASYVCLGTSNGQRGPIAANGRTADNCFTVDGLGTAVARAVKTDPAIIPGCPDLIRIDVGVSVQAGTPATATVGTPTAAAPGGSPTATVGVPTATPTRVATAAPPAPPTVSATAAATSTARPIAPLPPATGSGGPDDRSLGGLQLGIALIGLAAGAGGGLVLAKRRGRSVRSR